MARILIVDDDPVDRRGLKKVLERDGHEVACAADASTALASVMSQTPELILLDISIPRMDGLTLLWRIRETMPGRGIVVFVVSGHDDPEIVERARQLGAAEYLVKSQFKPDELLEMVRLRLPAAQPSSAAGDAASRESA